MNCLENRVALVTGASRGTGASVAELLAERGVDVVINFNSKSRRADEVAERVRSHGRLGLPIPADLTDEVQLQAMMHKVREEFGKLDLLVLNASGGLEKDKPANYAWKLNVTAQLRAVELGRLLMGTGSRIVFVTSHPAHFYDKTEDLSSYETVAHSKHSGEQALRALLPELAESGLSLVVVSADLIEDTIAAKLLKRADPKLMTRHSPASGAFLTVEAFATAIVNAAMDPLLENGATVLVEATM